MNVQKGLIHKIEKFSLHDGPGIRTLIIMKGCPLRCLWCSSPHTQSNKPEILYIKSKCKGCGICIEICSEEAISRGEESSQIQTDRELCVSCGQCIEACPNGARELSGQYYTPKELFQEVKKDVVFYRRSGGGITIGGGEPTMQAEFVGEFLSICRSYFIHTAMETSALTSWDKLAPLLNLLDLVYIDLKHMDESTHIEWTGVSNREILKNIKRATEINQVILRIPLIPGFNDSVKNISESTKFAKTLGKNVLHLEILPYHQFGIHKYTELEREYAINSIQPPSDEHVINLRDMARSFGIEVKIGGG